jgi:hypothetical protein
VTEVPRWAWIGLGLGLVAFGGLAGAAWWSATRGANYDRLLAKTGAPRELRPLAAIQRYTESRGNRWAGLGRVELFPPQAQPSNAKREDQLAESTAAAEAYDRNADAYAESPYPRRMWIFGSGGPYGLIPANALSPWRHSTAIALGKVGPYDVFDEWRATVCFVDYVYRLIRRKEFESLPEDARHWLAIKRGLAAPSLMADHEEVKARSRTVRQRATEAAQALGLSPDFLYERVPTAWPNYPGAVELMP